MAEDDEQPNLYGFFAGNNVTAGAQNYTSAIAGKVDAQFGVDYLKYGNDVFNMPKYTQSPFGDTALSGTVSSAIMGELYKEAALRANTPLSLADRAAGPYEGGPAAAVSKGIIEWDEEESRYGPALDNLTPEERAFWESGGTEGSWADAMGGVATPDKVIGRGRLDAVDVDTSDQFDSNETRVAWLAMHHPGALQAVAANGMKPQDVATVRNVFMAQSAVKRSMQMMDVGQMTAAYQLIGALPINQRILAAAFLDEEFRAASAAQADARAEIEAEAKAAQADWDQNTPQAASLAPTASRGAPGSARGVSKGDTEYDNKANALQVLLDATLWGVEQVTHIERARYVGMDVVFTNSDPNAVLSEAGGETIDFASMSPAERIVAAWNATDQEGFISQATYNESVEKFGKKTTDTMVAFYTAQKLGDPEAISEFYASIDGDPQATALITSAMRGENVGGDANDGAEAFTFIAAGDQGNYGNTLAGNFLGLQPDSAPFRATRDFSNVASWFVYDPLNLLFGAGKALRGLKYGLGAAAKLGNGSYSRGVAKMLRSEKAGGAIISRIPGLNRNAVRTAHDDFGRAVQAWVNAEGIEGKSAAMKIIKKRFIGKDNGMFTHADVKLAEKEGLFSAEDWARYYDKIADAEDIMAGRPIALTVPATTQEGAFDAINSAMKFDPEARAARTAKDVTNKGLTSTLDRLENQKVRRKLYVPHSSIGRALVHARVGDYIAGKTDSNFAGAMDRLERVLGPEWAALPPEEQGAVLVAKLSEDSELAEALGREFSKFQMGADGKLKRSFLGRRVDKVFDRNDATRAAGAALGLYKKVEHVEVLGGERVKKVVYQKTKGWSKKHGWEAMKDGAKRTFSRIPNTPHGLDTQTPNMAEEVVAMVRAAGMGDSAADIIRAAWVDATPAARQNMMIGLTRSFTKAMGIDAIDPTAEAKILSQMTGIGWKELYATNQIPRFAGVIADIRREATDAANAARQAAQGDPVKAARIAELEAQLAAAKTARKGPAAPAPNATYSIPNPDPTKPAREMKAGWTGENKLNRQPDGSQFPGNWPMDKDPFPVAHMQVSDDLADAAEGFLGRATAEGVGDVPAVDYQAVRVNKNRQRRIAAEYEKLPESAIDDPAVKKAYDDLIAQTEEQAAYMRDELGIEIVIVDKDPYANPAEMLRDVAENGRIQALSTRASNSSHPYMTDEQNDLFRAVHDFFGHALTGRGFDMHGEEAAWLAHSRMFGTDARKALTTETRGQNSWHHAKGESKRFADQKVALLPDDIVDDALSASFPAPRGFGEQVGDLKAMRAELRKLQGEQRKLIQAQRASIKDERMIKRAMKKERLPGGRLNPDPENTYNPSKDPTGKTSALYMGQTSDYMAVPNFRTLDSYAARASFLNALLFNNKVGSAVTELWVLGTLAGPRFQLRNGIEDVGLYALTGGSFGSFFRGRKLGQAIDSAMARADAEVMAHRSTATTADRKLAEAIKANRPKNEIDEAKNFATSANEALNKFVEKRTFLGRQKYGDHKKLGFVRTAIVNASEAITYGANGSVRDNLVSKMAEFLVPTTSSFERAQAARLGRDAVADLAARAVLRQKIVWNRKGLAKLVPNRAKTEADLSAKQIQYMKWEKDLLDSPWGLQFKDEAAESAQHYADGGFVVEKTTGNYAFDTQGNLIQKVYVNKGYVAKDLSGNALTEQMSRAMMARLRFMADKFGINQAGLHQAPEYWKALTKGDLVLADQIVDDVYRFARGSYDWPYVAERFRLADDLGAKEHVRRMMDDITDAFTTRDGRWNQDLWRAMRQQDEKGKWYFSTDAVDKDGNFLVSEERFMAGEFDTPNSLLAHASEDHMLLPADPRSVSTKMWEMMGRSLARMTRNPIYYGNYLKARQQLAPMEQAYARVFGEKYAAKRFTDAAAERAYYLTMEWVDNPNVRTNLSFQVRNIARYYRAQEDFARRALRMVKYDPGSIQRANLAWQAQQDVGFVYTDEYGDQYFVYPGSAAVMGVFQNLFGGLEVGGIKLSAAPMAFGGKTQWLSPSLDPQSWLPTVSSPWMALTLQPLLRTMPTAHEFVKEIERWAFGELSSNMDYADLNLGGGLRDNVISGAYQMLPPAFKKLASIGEGVLGATAPGSYGDKMMTKTIMAMAAADQIPRGEEWADQVKREEFHSTLERNMMGVSALSLIFGLIAPSSPQLMADYVSEPARQAAFSSLNPAFQTMIRASVDNGDTWEEATIRWMRENPKDSMFLEGTRESIGGAYVEQTMENVDFIKTNMDTFEKYPLGMTFLLPSTKGAESTPEAVRAMKALNLKVYKGSEKILASVANAEGNLVTDLTKAEIEQEKVGVQHYDAMGNVTDEWKYWEEVERTAEANLSIMYPTRMAGMGEWIAKSETEFELEARQVVDATRELADDNVPIAKDLLPLVDAWVIISQEYKQFKTTGQAPGSYDEKNAEYRDLWQGVVNKWIFGVGASYPPDRAEKVVKLFTYSMNKGWSRSITLGGEQP